MPTNVIADAALRRLLSTPAIPKKTTAPKRLKCLVRSISLRRIRHQLGKLDSGCYSARIIGTAVTKNVAINADPFIIDQSGAYKTVGRFFRHETVNHI